MVAYSFQRQFIEPIASRRKGQTIRAVGKRRHAWVGCQLQLYFGMRTQHCRKIIDDQACVRVDDVQLDFRVRARPRVKIGEIELGTRDDLDRFAVLDGFENWAALDDFWKTWHPDQRLFAGVMPGWLPGFWA